MSLIMVGCSARDELQHVVFAVIDGSPITAAEVRDLVLLKQSIATAAGKPIKPKGFKRWANSTALRSIPNIIAMRLLDRKFSQLGVRRSPVSDKQILFRYNRLFRTKCKTLDEFSEKIEGNRDLFLKQLDYESRIQAYTLSVSNALTVTDEELSSRMEFDLNERKKAIDFNQTASNRAMKCFALLNKNAPWNEMSAKFSEDVLLSADNRDFTNKWDVVNVATNQPNTALLAKLRPLKAGEWTEPVELDDGLAIVRVLRRENDEVTCARILFRLAQIQPETDVESLRDVMMKEAIEQHFEILLKSLHRQAKIEYPMGVNVNYEIFK